MKCFVVIRYNNEDNHDAESVGVFKTKERAIDKVLEVIKNDYDECSDDDLIHLNRTWFNENDGEVASWSSFKKIIKKNLINLGESEDLGWQTYIIKQHDIE